MSLNNQEKAHYSRHLLLKEIGEEGQEKLKKSKVLVIGAGGLGCPAAIHLGAAGVGNLGIIDFDKIDISNLHRQTAYQVDDIGRFKAEVLRERILANNPYIAVTAYVEKFNLENSIRLLEEYDLVLDGSDNFATRYLANDASFFAKKPLVFGAIHQFHGQATVFNYQNGPCYRCLFPEPPEANSVPNCQESGVIGVLPGIIGIIQATETIKIILQKPSILKGRFLTYDALQMRFNEFLLEANPHCPLCGKSPTLTKLTETDFLCNSQSKIMTSSTISPAELANEMEQGKEEIILIDVREEYEYLQGAIKNSHHIPLRMLESVAHMFKKEQKLVLYCQFGVRSGEGCRILQNLGLKNCLTLAGGLNRWQEEFASNNIQH